MARIHSILQGFVDLNLETDENISTRIVTQGAVQSRQDSAEASQSTLGQMNLPVPFEDVLEAIDINLASIKLAHIKGSRVYGLEDVSSDWDLTIVTSEESSYSFKEAILDGNDFDVHLYSQSKFQNYLDDHSMRELETLDHPSMVRLIDNIEFTTDINSSRLVNSVKTESDSLWNRARNELNSDEPTNDYTSLKRIFHSFRILMFAKQVLEEGKIVDFRDANFLYVPIVNSKETDFVFFENNFSALRDNLKDDLDKLLL